MRNRLLPVSEGSCAHRFCDEDFYIHCATHSYKHFSGGGNGIRSLLDVYVYLHAMGDKLDHAYIDAELAKLGIAEYDAMTRRLSELFFSVPSPDRGVREIPLSEEDRALLLYHLDSGTYGKLATAVRKRLTGSETERVTFGAKLRYCMRRLFPDMSIYTRHKILIPFFWFYRLFRALFFKTGRVFSELKTVFRSKS